MESARTAAHLSSASTIVGENALDTKVGAELDGSGSVPSVQLEDVVAYGFRGFISNQAAFNLKEDVDVLVDRVTVYDSELAFRLRGPAAVRVQNAVIYDVDGAARYSYEDGLPGAWILASTIRRRGRGAVHRRRRRCAGGHARGEPPGARRRAPGRDGQRHGHLAVGPEVFVDAAGHDHYLEGASPIDAGVDFDGVALDRNGTVRPVGDAFDVGAYEWDPGGPPPPTDAAMAASPRAAQARAEAAAPSTTRRARAAATPTRATAAAARRRRGSRTMAARAPGAGTEKATEAKRASGRCLTWSQA